MKIDSLNGDFQSIYHDQFSFFSIFFSFFLWSLFLIWKSAQIWMVKRRSDRFVHFFFYPIIFEIPWSWSDQVWVFIGWVYGVCDLVAPGGPPCLSPLGTWPRKNMYSHLNVLIYTHEPPPAMSQTLTDRRSEATSCLTWLPPPDVLSSI